MPDIAEVRRQRDARRVKEYLQKHPKTTMYYLFSTAYFLYYGVLDKNEVRSKIERFEIAEETPVWVSHYIK